VLAAFLALLSAATFAFNNASVRRGVLSSSVAQAMAITVPIGLPIFFVVAIPIGALGLIADFSPLAIFWLSLAGILHFVWGRYCNYRATKAMGAVLAGPVQQASLVFTLALAIWILGETLTPLRVFGLALVMIGPWLGLQDAKLARMKAETFEKQAAEAVATDGIENVAEIAPEAANPPFKPDYMQGYLFAALSATGMGASPILVRLSLQDNGIAVGVAGGLVSYAAATALFLLVLLWPGQWRYVWQVKPEAAKWFTISGVLVCLSQLFRYMALAVAPVTVVTPIQRLSILFRIYFAHLLNPQHEVFGGRVIVGTLVSLRGALALSVSTDLVLTWVPLPDAIVAIARWEWP